MTWVYVLGVAVIVVLWVIGLELGVFHQMVGEQLAQIHNALQSGHNEQRDLRKSIDRLDVSEQLNGIATTLDQISARVYDLREPGRNILAIREAARSIRESAAENYGAHQEEARIMYAGIAGKLDDIARDISAALSGSQRRWNTPGSKVLAGRGLSTLPSTTAIFRAPYSERRASIHDE
jgi:hypothetical protein